jgi:hypothetical protein
MASVKLPALGTGDRGARRVTPRSTIRGSGGLRWVRDRLSVDAGDRGELPEGTGQASPRPQGAELARRGPYRPNIRPGPEQELLHARSPGYLRPDEEEASR